jgi:radical SAM superfamily enzyme YgiQ (UPF0313 family)
MRIVFIYNGAENLGIEYISSFLKSKGHEVLLLFDPSIFAGGQLVESRLLAKAFNIDREIINKAVELKPDIVAFSAYTGNYRWCLNIAQRIKKLSNVPIVFGGVHTTAVPGRVLSNDFVDFAIVGEGEFAMLDLVEHLEKGAGLEGLLNISNICFNYQGRLHINDPRPYIRDLDSLPPPDKSLFYDKVPLLEENYLIMTSRGCPYDCTYCSNNMYHELYCKEKQRVRRRSPENVIEELLHAKKRGRLKLVVFADDVFTVSKQWLERFIEIYKSKINLPFFCSVHPLTITKERVSLLKEGGCWLITMGVQSGSERIRKEIFNRRGSNEKIIEAVSYIKEQGIKISVDNIFGAPSETEEDLKESLNLYSRIKPNRILTFWLTFYPKTKIIDYAKEYKMLSEEDIKENEEGSSCFTHDTGSVSRENIKTYVKYQLLFQLRSLVHNDWLFSLLSRLFALTPFKKQISRSLIFLNAMKNKDVKFFYMLKYLWAKKNTP